MPEAPDRALAEPRKFKSGRGKRAGNPVPASDPKALLAVMRTIAKTAPGFQRIKTEEWDALISLAPRCACGEIPAPNRISYARSGRFVYCSEDCRQRHFGRIDSRKRYRDKRGAKREAEAMAEALGKVH